MEMINIIQKFIGSSIEEFKVFCREQNLTNGNSSHGVTHNNFEIILNGGKIYTVTYRHHHDTPWGLLEVDEDWNKSIYNKDSEECIIKVSQEYTDWIPDEDEEGTLVEDMCLINGV